LAYWKTLTLLAWAALFAVAACSRVGDAAQEPDIRISIEQRADGALDLSYTLLSARARLDLGPSLGGYRAASWSVETPGLSISSEAGRDYLVADEGKRFREARITVLPYKNNFAKQYEPVASLSGGAVIYTGHFWPWEGKGKRLAASFDFIPASGAHAAAFGETTDTFTEWSSPFHHPAFVYLGAVTPLKLGATAAVIDPSAPDWVADALIEDAQGIFDGLAKAFGRKLDAPPDLFLIMDGEDEPGRLRYSGDALPGQIEIRLSGGGWKEDGTKAREILLEATAHEAAHLWQLAIRPSAAGAPDWIHEGGADAIAAELIEGGPEEAGPLAEERAACRAALGGRSLAEAEARGEWRASYDCGHVLAVIAAKAVTGGDVAAFWRAFIDRAEASGGYDEGLFLSMIQEKTGKEFADAVGRFPRTAYAAPDKELAALLAGADGTGAANR